MLYNLEDNFSNSLLFYKRKWEDLPYQTTRLVKASCIVQQDVLFVKYYGQSGIIWSHSQGH